MAPLSPNHPLHPLHVLLVGCNAPLAILHRRVNLAARDADLPAPQIMRVLTGTEGLTYCHDSQLHGRPVDLVMVSQEAQLSDYSQSEGSSAYNIASQFRSLSGPRLTLIGVNLPNRDQPGPTILRVAPFSQVIDLQRPEDTDLRSILLAADIRLRERLLQLPVPLLLVGLTDRSQQFMTESLNSLGSFIKVQVAENGGEAIHCVNRAFTSGEPYRLVLISQNVQPFYGATRAVMPRPADDVAGLVTTAGLVHQLSALAEQPRPIIWAWTSSSDLEGHLRNHADGAWFDEICGSTLPRDLEALLLRFGILPESLDEPADSP